MTPGRDPNPPRRTLGLPFGFRRESAPRRDIRFVERHVWVDRATAERFVSAARRRLSGRFWSGQVAQLAVCIAVYWLLLAAPGAPRGGLLALLFDGIDAVIPGTFGEMIAGLTVMTVFLSVIPVTAILQIKLWRGAVRRELLRCIQQPACFFCGYDHADLELDEPRDHRCPECGTNHPIATPTLHDNNGEQ